MAFCKLLVSALKPRVVIVKSRELHKLSNSYINYDQFIKKQTVEPNNNTKINQDPHHNVSVVCVVGVTAFRKTIPYVVKKKSDKVVEIGCADGLTSVMIAEHLATL
eukprot:Pgem_evm1s14005